MTENSESIEADTDETHVTEPVGLEAKEMTPEQLAEAEHYGRIDLACSLADRVIDLVYLGCAAFFLARPIDAWLAGFIPSLTLRVMALIAIVILLHIVVSFPLSFYSGFVIEHRFGLSRQSLGRWFSRYFKSNLLTLAFGAVMFAGLYWVIWLTGEYWWIVAAGFFFVVSIVMAQLVPVLIMPLFYDLSKVEDEELATRMYRLAQGTGLSIEGVYNMSLGKDTSKANAMLAGLGATRRVILGDTLLDNYSHDEIEVVLAHEIGHHVYRHIHKMMVIGAIYSAAGFWVCDRVVGAWAAGYDGGTMDSVFTAPMLMFVLGIVSMLLEPVQNFISRVFERQCDQYALDRTGMHEAFIAAFQKLAIQNKDDPNPHWLEVALFHDHPPIAERIAMAKVEPTHR
jgi:STE24 endopeptidase